MTICPHLARFWVAGADWAIVRKPVISSVFTDFLHEGHKGSWVCMRNPQGWRKLCRLWGTNSLLGPPASCQHKTSLVRSKGHGKHPSSGHRSYLMSLQPKHQNTETSQKATAAKNPPTRTKQPLASWPRVLWEPGPRNLGSRAARLRARRGGRDTSCRA